MDNKPVQALILYVSRNPTSQSWTRFLSRKCINIEPTIVQTIHQHCWNMGILNVQNGTHEPSQIEPKRCQERIKIEVWRVGKRGLEGPKPRSGRSFEQLGTVWTILRASGVVLEASWGRLGSILGSQEAIFGASWGQVGGIWVHPRMSTRFWWTQHEAFRLGCRFLKGF